MSNLNWPPEETVIYKFNKTLELAIPLYDNEKENNLEEQSK